MYHSISDDPEPDRSAYYKTCTSPQRFREHMQTLKDEGFTTTDLISLVSQKAEDTATDGSRRVVITFDDGFEDFYSEAWPVLNDFGFTATMFLPTDFIGDERCEFLGIPCLTWEEVRKLADLGITFGSHTCSHPKLVELDQASLESELKDSKQSIESRLEKSVDTFAQPFAFPATDMEYLRRYRIAVQETGFRACVTTTVGRVKVAADKFTLSRLPVNNADDPALLRAKLRGNYDWLRSPQRIAKKTKAWLKRRRRDTVTG